MVFPSFPGPVAFFCRGWSSPVRVSPGWNFMASSAHKTPPVASIRAFFTPLLTGLAVKLVRGSESPCVVTPLPPAHFVIGLHFFDLACGQKRPLALFILDTSSVFFSGPLFLSLIGQPTSPPLFLCTMRFYGDSPETCRSSHFSLPPQSPLFPLLLFLDRACWTPFKLLHVGPFGRSFAGILL